MNIIIADFCFQNLGRQTNTDESAKTGQKNRQIIVIHPGILPPHLQEDKGMTLDQLKILEGEKIHHHQIPRRIEMAQILHQDEKGIKVKGS